MSTYLSESETPIEVLVRNIIDESVEIKEQDLKNSIINDKSLSKIGQFKYTGKAMEQINHSRARTFYTEHYTDTLRDLLVNSEVFKKRSNYDKKLIQMEIDFMSKEDYSLKSYLHKNINKGSGYYSNFPNEFKNFKESYNELLELKGLDTQRSYTHSIVYKYQRLHKMIISTLIRNKFIGLEKYESITTSETNRIFREYITPEDTFDTIFTIMLKKARDSFFHKEGELFNEISLSVVEHEVINELVSRLFIDHITHGLVATIKYHRDVLPLDSFIQSVRNHIFYHPEQIINSDEYKSYVDGLRSVIEAFNQSGIFDGDSVTEMQRGKKFKMQKRLFFPTELSDYFCSFSVPPRVIRPERVTKHNIANFMIPISYGKYNITNSQNLFDSLNIANSKKFRINEKFLYILNCIEARLFPYYDELSLPIPSQIQINAKSRELASYSLPFGRASKLLINDLQSEIAKRHMKLERASQYRAIGGLSSLEAKVMNLKNQSQEELKEMGIDRKGGITRIKLAELLIGFPLYYTNTICGTTRAFAKEHILSRHVGCVKLLRCEYTSKRVTVQGLVNMMRAYYCDDPSELEKFENYIGSETKLNYRKIANYYKQNRIEYSTKEALSHFMLLSSELQSTFTTKKTGVLLQLDQVASGLTILGLLFQNKQLLKQCNVVKDDSAVGPYTYAMLNFKDYYDKNIEPKSDAILEMFLADKKIHKYAMMCYSYNQTHYGRFMDFRKAFYDTYKKSLNDLEYACLDQISKQYTSFLDELFPGLDSQIQTLNDIITLVVKSNQKINIRSIDGEVISWEHFKQRSEIRKKFNLRSMIPETYHLYTSVADDAGVMELDASKHRTKFLSYLVHSIDATLMRQFIRQMKLKHSYVVDQLFDCILVHPNEVDNLFSVIEETYKNADFPNYMDHNVFGLLRGSIDRSKWEEFDELVAKFHKYSDKSTKPEIDGDFKKMYTFES